MPTVSIIVPNFNHQYFLKERLDSIFNQTYQDFEVILLDDASIDNSIAVLNTYKNHPKVSHFIVNKNNSGSVFKQWSKGIQLAKGTYVWIAETDDFAEPTFLEQTLQAFRNHKNVSLAYTDSKIINEKGDDLGLWKTQKNEYFNTTKWTYNHTCEGKSDVLNYFFYKTTINNASAVLFKKQYISSVEFLYQIEKYKNVGDVFTYIHVALNGHIAYINSALNNYRIHNENATKKNTKSGVLFFEAIVCFGKAIDWLLTKKLSDDEKKLLIRSSKFILLKFGFKLIDYGHHKTLFNHINKNKKLKIYSSLESILYTTIFKMYEKGEKKYTKKILSKLLMK